MPKISLVVIAKNEERCIARCLQSAAPHVDAMLVLDTGSTDRTVEIARACGAQVHQTQWHDDFARARNESLDLADADWNLILDADEWIASGGDSLRSWIAQHPRAMGAVYLRNSYQAEGRELSSASHITRLLPRGVRFTGRVHEQADSTLPRLPLPVVVEHDGYLPAQMVKKASRNRTLLEAELQRSPDNAYLHYQLGKEHELAGDFASACAHYEQATALQRGEVSYTHDLDVRHLYCLGKARQFDTALGLAEAGMATWAESPDYFFVLGNVLLDKAIDAPDGNPLHWLDMAKVAWERCLEIGEQPALSGTVAGRGSYLAAFNLALACERSGQPERAAQLRAEYPMPT